MGLQIVLLSLILEFRRETHSKCPRTSENKSFIPVSIGIFMVAQHPSVYKQNSDCAIHPICSRSRQNLHRSSSYSQLASHSHLATQRIFCIFNSKAREWGLLGCCAENCELSMCLYLFYPWHTSTMSPILNPQSRKLFHFPRKLELLYHSQDEWWRGVSV